jgi:PAS domain-containing protein
MPRRIDIEDEWEGDEEEFESDEGRKRTEKALQASERRYRTLFERANDAIFLETEDDVIVAVNQRLATFWAIHARSCWP